MGTVAVAGGTGFVGSAIVAELDRRGERTVVLTHRPGRALHRTPARTEIRSADVVSGERTLPAALEGADALIISLGFPGSPVENPSRGWTFEAVDGAGTEKLIAAARKAGVGRVVYISGAGAAPDAARHWFRAKWRAETAVRESGIPYTILRPTWVYGPGDVSLNRFIRLGRLLPVVPLTGDGKQLLAPVFIDDVARLAVDALADPASVEQVFEVGGPETMTMRDVVRRALRVDGHPRPLLPMPAGLVKLGVLPLRVLPRPPLTPDAVDFVNQPATVDVAPLLERMPRRLTPFEEGLAQYLGAASRRP